MAEGLSFSRSPTTRSRLLRFETRRGGRQGVDYSALPQDRSSLSPVPTITHDDRISPVHAHQASEDRTGEARSLSEAVGAVTHGRRDGNGTDCRRGHLAELQSTVDDLHSSLTSPVQLRLSLAVSGYELDLLASGPSAHAALELVTPSERRTDIVRRLTAATTTSPVLSARSVWIDGPLVQAMKNGEGLLCRTVEDQHRISTAARVEISSSLSESLLASTALLQSDPIIVDSTAASSLELSSNSITEPAFSPVVSATSIDATESAVALARNLIATIASSHYSLTVRLLRAVKKLEEGTAESCIRNLHRHSLVRQIDASTSALVDETQVPSALLALQPSDVALCPHSLGSTLTSEERATRLSLSPALDTLAALLLSSTANPESLRLILSKPVKSLNVWEKSLLASHGRLRGDDTEPAITSLFPAIAAPGSLINRILSIELASLSVNDRDAAIRSAETVQLLSSELEQVCQSIELDFSSVQHIASWIAAAIAQVPLILVDLASDARREMAALQNSLILTTGKEMAPSGERVRRIDLRTTRSLSYQRLLERGASSVVGFGNLRLPISSWTSSSLSEYLKFKNRPVTMPAQRNWVHQILLLFPASIVAYSIVEPSLGLIAAPTPSIFVSPSGW